MKRVSIVEQLFKSTNFGDVLVVGGGISGIQAALDLAAAGFKAYLAEKSPAIGGHMAQLDKTFPTNDCSMCIESPKFIECYRHPNIELVSYAEVDRVEGEAGDFRVTLIKKPRYILEKKCTGCTTCRQHCPLLVPDPFNQNLSGNKAVHIHFAQAVPLVSYINEECLFLKEGECRICESVCKNRAVFFRQAPERLELKVGAVILAPGYAPFNPHGLEEFDLKARNIVTSLDYERILCATGPYAGEIRRPSDGKQPRKIAWIQCVGSRQVIPGAGSYCSAVCCTYTQKQVILTKDHDPDAECAVFHNDIRAYGKDFERFYQRAANLPGVRFIRSYVNVAGEQPASQNIVIRYATPENGVKEEEFELVVLAAGINPPADAFKLAEKFGVSLNAHGFCKTKPFHPVETTRPGIFVSGAFAGPADIPEAVVSASGAAARCGEELFSRRGRLAVERKYPPEKDVAAEEPRVGVFVCHCGANIGGVVDVPAVVESARRLPFVVHAQDQLFSCAADSARQITDTIREKGINRVVVAACTPRTHEPLFRDTLREAGINQYYFELANIREHCAWVHAREKEEATRKAKDTVRMAVARALRLQPLKEFNLPVNKAVLVVGAGIAGMTCALGIAGQGYCVHLVEREKEPGGMTRRIYSTLEGQDVQAYLRELIQKVYRHPLIRLYLDAAVLESSGYVGNFTTKVASGGTVTEIRHGAAVIATGAEEYKPTEYLYGQDDRVLTQLELEEKIARGSEILNNCTAVAMIQCVGSRQEDRNYCSRVCCSQAVKNALKLKELNPGAEIYVLFRDMQTYGFREDYYREAAGKDVKFIRYTESGKPQVEAAEEDGRGVLKVTVADPVLGRKIAIAADLVVLAAAVVPSPRAKELAPLFKVPLNPDGFFQEAHVKLRPVDFGAEGVYLCGLAHYPKHIPEAIGQAYGAAGRVLTLLARETVAASGSVCVVDEDRCLACGACISVCAYGAVLFRQTPQGKKAAVNPALCKGDGLCNTKCPTGAIALLHFTNEQILSQIAAAAKEEAAGLLAAGQGGGSGDGKRAAV